MLRLKGYCPRCPCWFDISDAELKAYRLCPCCLQPAERTSRYAWLPSKIWPLGTRVITPVKAAK
jgi:hypothetical protein